MTNKEVTNQILDLLQEWAKQDCPSAEWLPSRVEKVIQTAIQQRMVELEQEEYDNLMEFTGH